LMIGGAVILAALAWGIGRYILGDNPLAWPLFVFLAMTLQTAATLFGNHRPDLQANGFALLVFAALALVWTWRGRARVA
jgi:hypothetical protein